MIFLYNQKGIGVIGAALIASVMIAMLALLAGYQVENLSAQVAIQRRGLYGIDALEDFAVMAAQARQVWLQNGGVCPTSPPLPAGQGTVTRGANLQFCWPDNANLTGCIPNPLARFGVAYTDDANGGRLCLSAAANPIGVVFAPVYPSGWQKWEAIAKEALQKSMNGLQSIAYRLSEKAFAQSMPVQRPALPPPNTIDSTIGIFACTAATAGDVNCKRCTDAPGVRNVHCTTLQVCLRADGNCAPNERMTQVIGVIDR